jgi:hypothetical protein
MKQFNITISLLESNTIRSVEVFDIMNDLRENFKNRIKDSFFGFDVNNAFQNLLPQEVLTFKDYALKTYWSAIQYLEERFDFNESCFKYFVPLNLKSEITIESLLKIAKILNVEINNESGDLLFNELCLLRKFCANLTKNTTNIDKKWSQYFTNNESPILLEIVSRVLAIPISNAFVERLFSLMKKTWKDDRNRMCTSLIKAEICTKVNYNMKCTEFHDFVLKNKRLLSAAKSERKYKFRNSV